MLDGVVGDATKARFAPLVLVARAFGSLNFRI